MTQILIRDLPEATHAALRRRASEHHRSVAAEVRAILEAAIQPTDVFQLPALVVPQNTGGRSLADIVSEGRR